MIMVKKKQLTLEQRVWMTILLLKIKNNVEGIEGDTKKIWIQKILQGQDFYHTISFGEIVPAEEKISKVIKKDLI